jgi:hypothetical protein
MRIILTLDADVGAMTLEPSGELCPTNSDFARFPGLTRPHPRTQAAGRVPAQPKPESGKSM